MLAAPLQVVPHPPGVTTMVSVSSDGTQSNGISVNTSVTDDGRFVAFESVASNLVPDDTNNNCDVFVRDLLLGATVRVSVTTAGRQGHREGGRPASWGGGTKVVFVSESQY